MERVVLSTFGYYPWICGKCRAPYLVRRRYARRRSTATDDQY
jgi:hypothetical protein